MLLVFNVVYLGKISAQVARDLHRSKSWACEWLKRNDKEGIEGLKTRQKSGRPPEISEEVRYQIKKELKESSYGLDHKTGRRVNCKEKWNKISLYSYIPHPSKMGI